MNLPGHFVALVFCLSASAIGRADVPVLRAEIGKPVVPELMGGCSMKCAFPWTVEVMPAGTAKTEKVTVLNDELPSPAWTDTCGVGAKLTFLFPKKIPEEMEGQVPFYSLHIINGDWTTDAIWKANARVKKARLYYNGNPIYDVTFPDTRRWLHVHFEDIMVHSGDRMTLEVLDIYPGHKGAPLALSEVVLHGAH